MSWKAQAEASLKMWYETNPYRSFFEFFVACDITKELPRNVVLPHFSKSWIWETEMENPAACALKFNYIYICIYVYISIYMFSIVNLKSPVGLRIWSAFHSHSVAVQFSCKRWPYRRPSQHFRNTKAMGRICLQNWRSKILEIASQSVLFHEASASAPSSASWPPVWVPTWLFWPQSHSSAGSEGSDSAAWKQLMSPDFLNRAWLGIPNHATDCYWNGTPLAQQPRGSLILLDRSISYGAECCTGDRSWGMHTTQEPITKGSQILKPTSLTLKLTSSPCGYVLV